MRTEKIITKSELSWCKTKFSLWEKASEWKQLWDGCPFNLVRDSTTYEQTHLNCVNQHRFHIRKEQILLFQNWLSGMRSRAPPNFTGHLRFWMQKYLVQNWQELFTRTKFAVIIFRNFMKLSRWKQKMKIWENRNAFSWKDDWKNVYHTKYADWYRQSVAAYHSPFATLYWVSNKVALKVVCKGVWCLYNRRNSTWLLVDIATSLRKRGIFMIASVLH